jgi:anti-sigma B factor antagonist
MPDRRPEYQDIQDLCQSLLRSDRVPRVVVNLSELDMNDSAFLARLITLKKAMHSARGKLVLYGLRPFMREIFTYTRLDKFFDIYQRETDALDALYP